MVSVRSSRFFPFPDSALLHFHSSEGAFYSEADSKLPSSWAVGQSRGGAGEGEKEVRGRGQRAEGGGGGDGGRAVLFTVPAGVYLLSTNSNLSTALNMSPRPQ